VTSKFILALYAAFAGCDGTITNETDFYVVDGRTGEIDSQGTLRVSSKSVPERGFEIARDVQNFQLLDWRIGVLRRDGSLWIGDGPLSSPLVLVDRDVAAYQVAAARVGILHGDGTLLVAETGLVPRPLRTRVRAFQVLPDRIGVLATDGSLWIQDGMSNAPLQHVADGVENFQLAHEWVAYNEATGEQRLMIGQGQAAGMVFVERARGIRDFEIEVWRDPNAHDESRLRVAHVDPAGGVTVGGGFLEPRLGEHTFIDRFDARSIATASPIARVHWANGRLLAIDLRGHVQVANVDASGALATFSDGGVLRDVSWNGAGIATRTKATGERGAFSVSNSIDLRRPAMLTFGQRLAGVAP